MVRVDLRYYSTFKQDYENRHQLGWDYLFRFYGEGTPNAYSKWYNKVRKVLTEQVGTLEQPNPDDEILADNVRTTVRSKLQLSVAKRQAEALAKEQITYQDLMNAVREVFVADPLPRVMYEGLKDTDFVPKGRLITPVLLLSDLHSGAVYRAYEGLSCFNPGIFDQRIYDLATEVQRITRGIKEFDHADRLIICWGGDYIDGRTIFPGQHDETISLVAQFRYAIQALTYGLLLKIAPLYKEIVMLKVDGNHGRIGDNSVRIPKVMDSLDTLFMDMLELKCKDIPNITWDSTEQEFKLFTLHGWNFLLHHGHRNKGLTHTPVTGARSRKRDMETMLHQKIDVSLSGHYHSPGLGMDGFSYNITNGSLPGGSPFGESQGYYNPPVQVMFTVTENRPVETFWPIQLASRHECYELRDVSNY